MPSIPRPPMHHVGVQNENQVVEEQRLTGVDGRGQRPITSVPLPRAETDFLYAASCASIWARHPSTQRLSYLFTDSMR